jgi:protoporphyrinogen/coproporphyrinogen III oxidase
MKAVVVGGGHAGLAAAYRLKKAGWDVTLLEARHEVGGRARTFRKGPYLIEAGATQMSTGYQEYMKLANEVGAQDDLVGGTNKVILLRKGKQYVIDGAKPWTAAVSGALSLKSKLLMIRAIRDFTKLTPPMDVLNVSASHAADFETCAEYCDRRLNREIFDVLVDPLVRTYVLNRGAKASAVEWFSGIRNLAGQKFVAIKGGIQSLPRRVANMLDDVRLNAPVKAVRRVGGGVEVDHETASGTIETIAADACVVATTLDQTVAIAPDLRPAMGELVDTITYNQAVLVHIGYKAATRSDAAGVIVGTAEHPQIGLVWLEHNKIDDAAPKGHSLITYYFEHSGVDEVKPGDDAQFIDIAKRYGETLFPELKGQADMEAVSRWDRAIPHPAVGVYTAVDRMKSKLDPRSPIQPAGDYFTCTGQNSAIHWGNTAADTIIRNIGRRNSTA